MASDVDPDHFVIKELKKIAGAMPLQVLHCVALMIEGDKEGWHLHAWSKDIRDIITSALESGNPEVWDESLRLANQIGQRGHLDFRDLHNEIKRFL